MSSRLSSIEVKRRNRINVFTGLLNASTATKPELAARLGLSIPTVGMICDELMREGLVREAGMQASEGGRRAMRYEPCLDCFRSIGIDITRRHVYIALTDLKGGVTAGERQRFPFEDTEEYRQELAGRVQAFLDKHLTKDVKILGCGVAVAGIVSPQQDKVLYSHVLNVGEETVLNRLTASELRAPSIRFFNDATAACMAECYSHHAPESFVFVSLSNSVGGATVINNRILPGRSGREGELGHMLIVPGGRRCYCGKCGHYDPYGNALLLTEKADGSMQTFFERVGAGDRELTQVFEEYLHYLAIMIYNLHISTDLPVVLGGYVGSYLKPYLPRIRELVAEMNIFEESEDFVFSCEYNVEASAVGAASHFTKSFIEAL